MTKLKFLTTSRLKFHAGVAISLQNGRPSVILKGVSVMGVPVPIAWLGGLKHGDLAAEFGGGPGF